MSRRFHEERAFLVERKHAKSPTTFYLALGQGAFFTTNRDDAYRFATETQAYRHIERVAPDFLGYPDKEAFKEDRDFGLRPEFKIVFHSWEKEIRS